MGARDSNLKEYVIAKGYDYISIDIDFHPSLHVVADGEALPFDADSQVLEHVFDPKMVIREVARVLKGG
ncbi:MAG: hypothetical protein GWP03_06590, partial [Proteobacteria bacterium]|nr:hypothetical protein [Pseudomonadota bacterium]